MQRKWVKSDSTFLNYIAAKFSQSVKASLVVEEIVVTKVDESLIL